MSTQEILAELPRLSQEERTPEEAATPKLPRVAGLHAGQYHVAEDFDEPLPDSFWFGEDA